MSSSVLLAVLVPLPLLPIEKIGISLRSGLGKAGSFLLQHNKNSPFGNKPDSSGHPDFSIGIKRMAGQYWPRITKPSVFK